MRPVEPAVPPVWPVLTVAALLRLVTFLVIGMGVPDDPADVWAFGQEAACCADSLLRAEGPFDAWLSYGDPWGRGTGPSGWLTPPYPAVVALAMMLGGGATQAAAWLLFAVHLLASLATCVLIERAARRWGLAREGRLAAWIWAFLPASIWSAATVVWDQTLVAFGVALFAYVVARIGPRPPLRGAALAGIFFGLLLLLNPAPLMLLPAVFWIWWRGLGSRGAAACALAFGATAATCVAPWIGRNAVVLGSAGLRTNLGVELRVGNNDQAFGRHVVRYHPSHTEAELARYCELGEHEYSKLSRREALAWIAENPGGFARLVLRRAKDFWFSETPLGDPRVTEEVGAGALGLAWFKWFEHALLGLLALVALARMPRGPAFSFLLGAALLFQLPYLATHVTERYRLPIAPLLVLAVAWLALAPSGGRQARDPSDG